MGVFCRTQRQDVQSGPMRDWYRNWGPPGLRLGSWVSSSGFSLWVCSCHCVHNGFYSTSSLPQDWPPRSRLSVAPDSLFVLLCTFILFLFLTLLLGSLGHPRQEWPPQPILPGISHPNAQHRQACLWFLFHIPERDLTEPACSAQASPTGQLSGR